MNRRKDEQGSTVLITDENQKFKNQYWYDAFGSVLEAQEEVHNRITYTGQQFDGITGQYYLRARFYNPVIGRFTQEDTYRGDGLNLYAYCENNPVRYYDSTGYSSKSKERPFALENELPEGGAAGDNRSIMFNETGNTRVGRWMSKAEYDKMVETGYVQMSEDNKVHVANPADIDAFGKQAPKGSLYVEFDVSSNTMSSGGKDGWGIINGPGSLLDRLNARKGLPRITEMPQATNIEIKGSK